MPTPVVEQVPPTVSHLNAESKRIIALHEAGHALIAYLTPGCKEPLGMLVDWCLADGSG